MAGVTILEATDYAGQIVPLGLSAHAAIPPPTHAPMVEYHLRLEDVETVDSDFSLTKDELRGLIEQMRSL
jgi:sialic acid synthase SpsE